jgi:hypothetical protein
MEGVAEKTLRQTRQVVIKDLTSLAFEKSLESQPLDFYPPVACI